MKDINGKLINDGDTIYNEHDRQKWWDISSKDGKLCFSDGEILSEKHQTHLYWEIVK